MGHLATQSCIDDGGILPLLHALEGVPGENEIGAKAENLLDTLSDKEGKGDGFLAEKVHKLRHATRDEMRRRALRKREEMLQVLNFKAITELGLFGYLCFCPHILLSLDLRLKTLPFCVEVNKQSQDCKIVLKLTHNVYLVLRQLVKFNFT